MTPRARAQLQIHFCVVLWGFTAIFGRLISLAALPLVLWRMLIVTTVLSFVPRVWRAAAAIPWRLRAAFAGIGAVVGIHWLTFYGAIKLSNASVGATCMALAPVFLAVVEPLVLRRRFYRRDLLLGVLAVPGVWLVIGGVPAGMRKGIALGVFSALLVAVFAALNKRLIERADALAVTWIELGTGASLMVLLSLLVPHAGPAIPLPGPRDAAYLVTLAVGCTLVPYSLALVALRQLSAFMTQLVTNLEPVYAILLAMLLLSEHHELTPRFYAGVAVILTAVLAYPLLRRATGEIPDVSAADDAAESQLLL